VAPDIDRLAPTMADKHILGIRISHMMVSQEFGHVWVRSRNGIREEIIKITLEKGRVTVPITVASMQIHITSTVPNKKALDGVPTRLESRQ
jgi:hypothetical protein